MQRIGISDIRLYAPSSQMKLDTLVTERQRWQPRLGRHLERALRVTGQKSFRFPGPWEDTATMAAEAARSLLANLDEKELSSLRYLVTGTETGLDHSKPVAAYLEGMLQSAGIKIPQSISTFQVQHACAGGTLGLLSVASLLAVSGRKESGVVVASDISRYETETTAEITHGAGAAALLVETNPRLIDLDLASIGYCSKDVDDFFRPFGSRTARVDGRYSMECYIDNFEQALADHAERQGVSVRSLLEETDLFVLHSPFANMPEQALIRIITKEFAIDQDQAKSFLESKGFYAGTKAVAEIGNTYTASMYMVLAHLLAAEHGVHGSGIRGKRILFASYGSGNTMAVFSGKIAEAAPQVIASWDLDALHGSARQALWSDYLQWLDTPTDFSAMNEVLAAVEPSVGHFALKGYRADGYREYAYLHQLEHYRSRNLEREEQETVEERAAL